MLFDTLENHRHFIPTIARWFFEAWGHEVPGNSVEHTEARIRKEVSEPGLPVFIIAIEDNVIAGVAMLKTREMDIYPEKEFWLGGVYVSAAHRKKGLGAQLVEQVISEARSSNISVIYLQTEALDGGMYTRIGWEPVEQIKYRGNVVLVMEKHLH